MTPFQRLSEAKGQDPWLDSAADRLREGDPWAALSPQRVEQLSALALNRVHRKRRAVSVGRRRLGVVLLLVGSAAMAALGSQVVRALALGSAPTPPPVTASPVPAPTVSSVENNPPLRKEAPTPPQSEKPAVRARPKPADGLLRTEADVLLIALRQLRVDRNPEAALATLQVYRARFPKGALQKEAAALRTEAQRDPEVKP